MPRDQRIDEYIARAAPFAQPILAHIRDLVHETIPDAGETIKWGMPHFTFRDKNVAGLAAFKSHASFGVHGEAAAPEGLGQYGKLRTLADLPPDAEIAACLGRAVKRIEETGTAIRHRRGVRPPKPGIPVPEDFSNQLSPAASAFFDSLAPSHRRDYLEWITEARRPETRARRIAQAIEWLAEGKKRNWKYENC